MHHVKYSLDIRIYLVNIFDVLKITRIFAISKMMNVFKVEYITNHVSMNIFLVNVNTFALNIRNNIRIFYRMSIPDFWGFKTQRGFMTWPAVLEHTVFQLRMETPNVSTHR